MDELLAVRRMLELEKMATEMDIIFPLTLKEWEYLERAEKMPYEEVANYIDYLRKHLLVINQIKFMKKLEEKYSVSEDEINQRFEDVYRILRYKNAVLNEQLNNQKQMIKRMKGL